MTLMTKPDALHARRMDLLAQYEGRAPRYTSYPTAVQFSPAVGPAAYGEWLSELPTDAPISIYAHVPFCARLCWFCGCNTRVVHARESIGDYVGLLVREMALVEARLPGRTEVNAVHLGGGTPNLLSPADLDGFFGALRRTFSVARNAEIAAEIDPVQLTAEWVAAAVGHGLNRASLGVQDLSPAVQAAVNRIEPFEVVVRAADLLREAGVEAINIDLMYGLPRQRTADVLTTLDQVLTLRPRRVALFGYAHVPWVKTHQKLINDADLPVAAERLQQSAAAAERLAAAGYQTIGLDHFALPDDPLAQGAIHRNFQGYTTDGAQTLLGFGASAIGRLPPGFVQNHAGELAWRRSIEAGELATARGVALTPDDRFRGEIIERLMCDFTVDLDQVCARHGRSLAELSPELQALGDSVRDGVVRIDGARVTLTELGRPFVRTVCMVFDAYVDAGAVRHSQTI